MDGSLGLSAAEMPAYLKVLAGTHKPRWTYTVLDLDGRPLATLPTPEDGSITADRDADITRGLTGNLFDPDHVAQVDTTSPADGTLTLDRLIRVQHTVHVPDLIGPGGVNGRDVTTTPFYGWLTKADRDGDTVAIEGQGLEARAKFGCSPMSVDKGTFVVDAIRRFLAGRYGETRFRFPSDVTARLLKPVTVGWQDDSAGWPVCLKLAADLDLQLFYSCDGWCTLRPEPIAPVVTFLTGADDSANLTSVPKATTDALAARNRVEAFGAKKLRYSAVADDTSAVSRTRLARNGVPFDMPEVIEDTAYSTSARVKAAARAELAKTQKQTQDLSATAVPIPHLDVGDLATMVTGDYRIDYRLNSFTLPTTGEDMTINRRATLNPNRSRIRA